jgi:soluble lytic murein transglycosylase-like protein
VKEMPRLLRKSWWRTPVLALAAACLGTTARAAEPAAGRAVEYVTLKNGFDLICDHREAVGDRVRLYTDAVGMNFVEVDASDIASDESVLVPVAEPAAPPAAQPSVKPPEKLTDAELKPILARAQATYNIDADLLASVVRQESDGQTHAVSRTGARGLMQLMPGTASELGVSDSFAPSQNIEGGTAYLDALLKKYHDNLPLALAAYNAGPAAVDRWHGIPPYRETRVYVARVIHEYNRRYALRRKAGVSASPQMAALAQ